MEKKMESAIEDLGLGHWKLSYYWGSIGATLDVHRPINNQKDECQSPMVHLHKRLQTKKS